jgi:glycosyltransferase involved in cell wall biosynthesis
MTRILFLGDLAPTGFGSVTMGLGSALLDGGDDVRFLSLNEWGALPEPFASRSFQLGEHDGWIHRPESAEEATAWFALMRGLFTGESWADGWAPEAAILLGDFEATRRANMIELMPEDFPAFHYCPVEGVDLPPRWGLFWNRVTPVAMCQFGADEIAKVMRTRPPVAYHGVAPEFHPATVEHPIVVQTADGPKRLRSREACRKLLDGGDPKRTVLFRADRHMPRKQYNALLRSLMPLLAARPEVDLWLHMPADMDDRDQGGNIHDTLSKYPAELQRRVKFTNLTGAPREVLAALYNAADLYVTNSAEGFGLCVAEALACGTPAIGPRYSSIPEVIGPAGVTVREGNLIDNEYDHFWWHADEARFRGAVGAMLDHPSQLRALGALGPKHVRDHFSWAECAAVFSRLAAGAIRSEVAA